MAALGESGSDPSSDDPFVRLGLSRDAGFDQVQAARDRCVAEAGADEQAKARFEAAYDAVLMARLRDRQQGQVTASAATASQREESAGSTTFPTLAAPGSGVLASLRNRLPDPSQSLSSLKPEWSLVDGQGRIVRIIAGFVGIGLILFSAGASNWCSPSPPSVPSSVKFVVADVPWHPWGGPFLCSASVLRPAP